MGYYLIPHPLNFLVAQHADDPGPVSFARVDGAHNLQVFLGDVSVRIDLEKPILVAQVFLDIEHTVVAH